MKKISPKINLQFFAEDNKQKDDPNADSDKDKKKKEGEPAKQEDPNGLQKAVETLTQAVTTLTDENKGLRASVEGIKAKQEKFEEVYKEQFGERKPQKEDVDPNIKKSVDVFTHIISVTDY